MKISKKNFFKTSNKINGKLNLTSEKIYSSYNLIKSLEISYTIKQWQYYNRSIVVKLW